MPAAQLPFLKAAYKVLTLARLSHWLSLRAAAVQLPLVKAAYKGSWLLFRLAAAVGKSSIKRQLAFALACSCRYLKQLTDLTTEMDLTLTVAARAL